MDISGLKISCGEDGRSAVEVWVKCRTREECDDIIAWLQLAKNMLGKWEKIRNRDEKTPRAPKAPAGQDEDSQRRQVQDQPQAASGTNGK